MAGNTFSLDQDTLVILWVIAYHVVFILLEVLLIGLPTSAIKKMRKYEVLSEAQCKKAYRVYTTCTMINMFVSFFMGYIICGFIIWLPARIVTCNKFRNSIQERLLVLSNIPRGTPRSEVEKVSPFKFDNWDNITLKIPYGNGYEVMKLHLSYAGDRLQDISMSGSRTTFEQR